MRVLAIAVLVAGCQPTASTTKDTDTTTETGGTTESTGTTGTTGATGHTGDSGTTETACAQVAAQSYQACLETTAAPGTTTTPYYAPTVVQGTGTVTDVGGDLPDVPGSEPIQGFQACGADHEHQVRLVDGYGDTWTFGWSLDPADGGASADAIEAGATLDFYGVWEFLGYSAAGAMVLSDATGPLFVLELEPELTEAERGGVTVQLATDSCVLDAEYREYYQVTFGWEQGSVDLWAGQTAVIPLPARSLSVLLGDSSFMLGCADGCGIDWWAEWAEK